MTRSSPEINGAPVVEQDMTSENPRRSMLCSSLFRGKKILFHPDDKQGVILHY